jgi:protein-disulfide isomerase
LPFRASDTTSRPASMNADFGANLLSSRRALAAVLSLAGIAALAAFAPGHLIGKAAAQSPTAALVAKPGSLPDMALGSLKAPVTIVEYASMSCPHCASFEQNVFPMIRSKYIDTGKVRYVFRAFPLDDAAAVASMLARCIAGDDAEKYFDAVDRIFKRQYELWAQPKLTLESIGQKAGMTPSAIASCEADQALLNKIAADQRFANAALKVESTPTFFLNGEMLKGNMSFEEIDMKIKSLLRK